MNPPTKLCVFTLDQLLCSTETGDHALWNKPAEKCVIVTHVDCREVDPIAVAALLAAGYNVERRGREVVVRLQEANNGISVPRKRPSTRTRRIVAR